MADNTIDTLQLKIESDAQQASNGIERLAQTLVNLEKATGKGESDLGKFANALRNFSQSFKNLEDASGVVKTLGEIDTMAKKVSKTPLKLNADDIETALDKLREQFKDAGTDFKFTGSAEELQKAITSTSAQLDKLYAKEDKLKAIGGNIESSGVKSLIYDIQMLTNKLEILRNAEESASRQDIISPTIHTMADANRQSLEDFVQEIQHYKDVLKAGGVETEFGKDMSIALRGAQTTLEQLTEEFPQATKEISELQSVIDQMGKEKPFAGMESGTKNIESEIESIQNTFGEVSKAIKLSSLTSEDFQKRLNSLVVPTTLEENLSRLQSKLKSVEEQEQKLVYQQEKGLVLGTIELDSDAFRKYEVAIKETQLTAEMLREKIAQVTKDIEKESAESAKAFNENLANLKIPEIREENADKLKRRLARLEADLDKFKTNLENDITMGRIVVDDSGYQKAMEKITLTEKAIEATRDKLKQVGTADTGLEKTASSMSNAQAIANMFSRAISNLISKLERLGKGAINVAINGFKKFGDGIRKAVSNIKKLIGAVAKFTKENKKSNASLGLSFKTILKYVFGIRSLYMLVRKIRQAFKEGMQNLVQYSGEVNHSVSLMTSALGALKNALAVAFAPIVNIVAPYLTKFINLLTSAFNAVGRFFAALTGKKIATQATKFYKDYAESLNGVGGAAKDASKALQSLGIDELNVLNQNEDEDGGGGGVDIEDMFTDVAIEGAISDWAQRIRDAFMAGNWEELGKTIAEMVNAGLQKLYDAIVDITPKVEQALKNFARVFNSFVEYLDWDLLGRTIGAGINLLVKAFNALTGDDGINFERLGNKLSVGFRGLVDEINWRELGNALGNGFMVAWRILEGFVEDMWRVSEKTFLTGWAELGIAFAEGVHGVFERVNFGSIGKTLADGFNGIFEIIRNFNQIMSDNGTWQEIADNVSNGLNNAIKGIRPIEAAQALGKFVTDLLGTLLEVAENTPWHLLGTKIGKFLENIPWLTIFKQVTSTITTILGGLFSGLAEEILRNAEKIGSGIADAINFIFSKLDGITEWIKKSNFGKRISDGLNAMIDGVNWKENGQKLNKLITAFLNEILVAVQNIDWKKLGKSVGDFLDEIDWKGIFSKTFDIIKETLFGLIGGLEETATGKIGLAVGGMAVAFKGLSAITPILEAFFGPEGKLYGAIITGVGTLATGLVIGGKDFVNACFDFISGILDKMIKAVDDMDWAEVWHNIVTALGAIISKTPEILGKIKALSISLITHLVAGLLEYVVSGQVFKDLAEFALNLIKGIVEGVASAVGALLEIPRLIFDAIVNGLKKLFGIHSPSTVMAEIGGFIMQGLINGVTSLVNLLIDIFHGIKEKIVSAFSGLTEFFSNLWIGIQNIWSNVSTWFNTNVIQPTIGFFRNLYENVTGFFRDLWTNIQNVWSQVASWFSTNVVQPLINFFRNIYEDVLSVFRNLWNGIQNIWGTVSTWFNTNVIQPIVNFFKNLYENVLSGFNSLWRSIQEIWSNASTWFNTKVVQPIIGFFKNVFTNVSSFFRDLWKGIQDIWNGAPEWFNQKIIQPIVKFFGSMGDNLKGIFNGIIDFITGVFSGNWQQAWNGIVAIFKGIINIIPSIMEGVANGIIGAINGIISGLNFIGGIFDVNIPLIPSVNLPRFKDGGLIMSHMVAEIGEYGRKEAILPLENRKSMSMIADSIMENSKGTAFNDNQISDELLQEQNALLREQNKLLTQIANTRLTAVLDTRDTLAGLREQANREGWSFAT